MDHREKIHGETNVFLHVYPHGAGLLQKMMMGDF
jgi:hypothetical protein